MKKLIILLVLSLLLVGCGSSDSNTNSNTLTVGMECNYAPFNWTQTTGTAVNGNTPVLIDGGNAGYCWGYDVLIAQKIAEAMDKELVIKKIAWDGLVPAIQANDIDLIIAGMTDNAERRASLDFTTPYYQSEMVLIVRKDSSWATATNIQDFKGARVVAQLNTFHNDLIEQINGAIHETPLATFPLMTVALQNDAADAMVSELPVAMSITAANSDLTYIQFSTENGFEAGADTSVSIATAIDSTIFDQVQKALDSIDAETRTELMQFALANQPE
ncbi:MAG: transporter substrate-binding domain-containing protein [Erysipelotrichaceae bacterium]